MSSINLNTGPVLIPPAVMETWKQDPIPHRSAECKQRLRELQDLLTSATHARYVQITTGSGTLANEIMFAQISRWKTKGAVLANGEFGHRMAKQCARWGIDFDLLSMDWGTSFTIENIEEFIQESNPEWLLFCACESSSGARVELEKIYQLAATYHFKVCVDAMTAIGNYSLDLSKATLATASSGKGLASLSGLCLIFSDHIPEADPQIPTYLDLGFYFEKEGMPYTISSNHINSLIVSSQIMLTQEHYEKILYQSQWLNEEIQDLKTGTLLNNVFPYTSHILTWQLPPSIWSAELGKQLEEEGVLTSYQSLYQVKANVIQFALMSDHTQEEMNNVMRCIRNVLSKFG